MSHAEPLYPALADEPTSPEGWLEAFRDVRAVTEQLCIPLETEDYVIQSMDDVSPPKWHLAHVTWFFEAFLLKPFVKGYVSQNDSYDYLFNSYYETHSSPFPRPRRGLLSRPTVADVYRYRHYVDEAMELLLCNAPSEHSRAIAERVCLGIHHEQQHQELLAMDIKHILAQNPLRPIYSKRLKVPPTRRPAPMGWRTYEGGLLTIGLEPDSEAFAFDNERPAHRQYLEPFELATRPVTNQEYIRFMEQGGYQDPALWLSDGWHLIREKGWTAPLYWVRDGERWYHFTLTGLLPVDTAAPVCHVSFYEADAFARWAGGRLPTEAEWEHAAVNTRDLNGNFADSGYLQPVATEAGTVRNPQDPPLQMFGDVWEWTGSAYRPYPGFRTLSGSLGEYNGKFMSGQMVLRGGCCATPASHVRPTYRNFFPPSARWAFSGFRLAREATGEHCRDSFSQSAV
ncbi:ergothioneine biosynthesis protein EgtB [Marinobacter orientalis]|uniref:Ergothioneine biosynthesis protein EgtB n=1 Tax=Marinobacter orientalis TaxID=1928859 RepID=A0A7Y0REW2_9GAMM|nr:ergothioneine biosynthesis protein EgtB [Marinobacter orientalis]NMT64969.1 ergothioneine biosynthesis protein EgtB [Marinobacter orientalis]TGX48138.1 ergothioneine biosynthesis protein EgtB [Marinobacter orientalis]